MAGSAYASELSWWPMALAAAAAVSSALLLLTFTRWWPLALAINLVFVVVAVRGLLTT